MKSLAIIPARGGSKRIPGKNIRVFLGKPVIAYSVEAALSSGLFDEVMVSTDDPQIAAIAEQYGANVPFLRTAQTANDTATVSEVVSEVLANYKNTGIIFDLFCCLFPTAPFITGEKLKAARTLLIENNFDSVFPVVRFSYPILRSLKIENNRASMNWPEHLNARSQDLPPAYHDSGQFYWMQVSAFLEQGKIFAANSGAVVVPEMEVQDIDSEDDWQMAELKWKLLNNSK